MAINWMINEKKQPAVFLIELDQYSTEWLDYGWAKPIPFINEKFGKRPKLYPKNLFHEGPDRESWKTKKDLLIENTVKNNPVLYLQPGSTDSHFQKLFDACRKMDEPRLIIADEKIRSKHKAPSNVRVIHTHGMAYQYSKMFDESKLKPVLQRKVNSLEHSFMLMASHTIGPAPYLLMMLKELGALEDALCGSTEIKSNNINIPYEDDKLAINDVLKDLKQNYLGDDYVKYHHEINVYNIEKLANKCHFFVSMDKDVFYDFYIHWSIAEKHLQCFTSTAPVLAIWSDAEAQQMKEWGFRVNVQGQRYGDESIQDVVKRYCKEILYYTQMTKNKDWAQAWQDLQGEDTYHNFQLCKNLHKNISNEIVRQIDELPNEFKNL